MEIKINDTNESNELNIDKEEPPLFKKTHILVKLFRIVSFMFSILIWVLGTITVIDLIFAPSFLNFIEKTFRLHQMDRFPDMLLVYCMLCGILFCVFFSITKTLIFLASPEKINLYDFCNYMSKREDYSYVDLTKQSIDEEQNSVCYAYYIYYTHEYYNKKVDDMTSAFNKVPLNKFIKKHDLYFKNCKTHTLTLSCKDIVKISYFKII